MPTAGRLPILNAARECASCVTPRLVFDLVSVLVLDEAPTFERTAQGHFIGIFEVTANG
jgi:hypothetical protein